MDEDTDHSPPESHEEPAKKKRVTASVEIRAPDDTFQRYRIDDQFPSQPSGKGKDALFEALQLDLYKPKANCLSFRTSEAKIGVWIRELHKRYVKELPESLWFTWREQDKYECPSRAEKLIIHVHKKDTDEQLFVVTVSLSTGLIMIQSKHYKHWATTEFPQLLSAVENANCTTTEESDSDINSSRLQEFTDIVCAPKQSLASSSVAIPDFETPVKNNAPTTCSPPGLHPPSGQPDQMSPSRVRTIRRVQEKVSNLDRDMAELRMNLEQSSDNFECLTTEQTNIKELVMRVEQDSKVHHAQHLDKMQTLESCVNQLTSLVTKLEQKQQSLNNKCNKLSLECKSLQEENLSLKMELDNIKTNQVMHGTKIPEEQFSSAVDRGHDSSATVAPEIALGNRYDLLSANTVPIIPEESSLSDDNAAPAVPEEQTAQQDISHNVADTHSDSVNNTENESHKTTEEVIIIMDSNGKFINTKKLCKKKTVKRIVCFTTAKAKTIIESPHFKEPKSILIHVGTNDMDHSSNSDCIKASSELVKTASKAFPTSKIIFSSLLVRQDDHQTRIRQINSGIAKLIGKLPNVHIIDHSNITTAQLHDNKHLNITGVRMFAKNIIPVLHGRPTSGQPLHLMTPRITARHQSVSPSEMPASSPSAGTPHHFHQSFVPSYSDIVRRGTAPPSNTWRPVKPHPQDTQGKANQFSLPEHIRHAVHMISDYFTF